MLKHKFKNRNVIHVVLLAHVILSYFSCRSATMHPITQREPAPSFATTKAPVPEAEPEKPRTDVINADLYSRQKDIKIRRKTPINETGSLTDLNDPRAYLFGFERPIEVGMFIDVKIASNRADPSTAGSADSAKESAKPADEASLLKALPNLDPAGKNKPVLVKNIKMQILERFENGDVLVMHKRRSVREGQGAEITVTARMSAEALSRAEQASTLDLADIDWRESSGGEIVTRKSANWEDEYSLRLSGFDETKSKEAMALEDKREELKVVRDKLETEIKALATERQTMTKERAGLLEEKSKDDAKIADLQQQNAEKQKKIEELTPKEEEENPSEDPSSNKKAETTKDAKDAKDAKNTKSTTDEKAKKETASDKGKKDTASDKGKKETPSDKTASKSSSSANEKSSVAKKSADPKKPAPKDAAKKG